MEAIEIHTINHINEMTIEITIMSIRKENMKTILCLITS